MLANHDRVAAVCLMALSASAFIYADRYPDEAAIYPRMVSGLMLVFAGGLFLRSLLPGFRDKIFEPLAKNPRYLLAAALVTLVFFIAVGWIGFYLAGAIFIPAMAWIGGYRNVKTMALTTGIYLVGIYLVFGLLFGRSLMPGGFL